MICLRISIRSWRGCRPAGTGSTPHDDSDRASHSQEQPMTEAPTITNPLRAGLRMQRTPEPCTVVIFGATGDLTHRKLMPALYNLQRERLLPPGFNVVG